MSIRALRPVRSEQSDVDFLLARTQADDRRRAARAALAHETAKDAADQLANAFLHLTIAVIEAQDDPGTPVATITVAGTAEVGAYQLPTLAAELATAAIQKEFVEFMAARGVDPELVHRLASASTALDDNHRPALRALTGGAR